MYVLVESEVICQPIHLPPVCHVQYVPSHTPFSVLKEIVKLTKQAPKLPSEKSVTEKQIRVHGTSRNLVRKTSSEKCP